jgi:hypothetical protein
MATIDTLLAADATGVFLSDFADTVTITKPDTTTYTIKAVIDYAPPSFVAGDGQVLTPFARLMVANSATAGIPAATFDRHGAWKVTMPDRPGGTNRTLSIYMPPAGTLQTQDAGMLTIFAR